MERGEEREGEMRRRERGRVDMEVEKRWER